MAQTANIDGRNNIVVQIVGDGNTVVPGHPHLTLSRYLTRRRIDADIDFLSPYTRSIPLIGREREMTELRAWLASEKPISVRVMIGGAGAGKTRLAIELIEQAIDESWDAGFIGGEELARFRAQQNLSTWDWRKPTLAVVDYVASHAERLAGWLKELADNSDATAEKSFRLLLLERHADTASGWWQRAFGRGGFGLRREVIDATLSERGTEARAPPEGEDRRFDIELTKTDWAGDPLFLMMAGVLAAERSMGQVLALGRTDLTLALAERELDRLAKIAQANALDPDVSRSWPGT